MGWHVGQAHWVWFDALMVSRSNRAELGRAAWKVLHTTMARFPDTPTEDESTALQSYVLLFARLYPWYPSTLSSSQIEKRTNPISPSSGECATHFRQILTDFPPQVSSRSTAAAWACHVHNEVNKSLRKELFDCSKIGDFYDCGCGGEEDGKAGVRPETAKGVQNEREVDGKVLRPKLELEG